jgi:hypothetical protein
MKTFVLKLLIPLFIFSTAHIDSAKKYLYVREVKPNRSTEIDQWNAYVGNKKGSPYCAAFTSYQIRTVSKLKSGSAVGFITKNSIRASEVLRGKPVPPGSLVIWRKGNEMRGHVGIVVEWNRDRGTTIEANTGTGDQSEGDGVYIKQRRIVPGAYFRIVYFTPV